MNSYSLIDTDLSLFVHNHICFFSLVCFLQPVRLVICLIVSWWIRGVRTTLVILIVVLFYSGADVFLLVLPYPVLVLSVSRTFFSDFVDHLITGVYCFHSVRWLLRVAFLPSTVDLVDHVIDEQLVWFLCFVHRPFPFFVFSWQCVFGDYICPTTLYSMMPREFLGFAVVALLVKRVFTGLPLYDCCWLLEWNCLIVCLGIDSSIATL